MWNIRLHNELLPENERLKTEVERYRRKFEEEVEPQLAQQLEGRTWITGEEFTAADIIIVYNLSWSGFYGLAQTPALRQYIARAMQRRPAQVAYQDMNEFPGMEEHEEFSKTYSISRPDVVKKSLTSQL